MPGHRPRARAGTRVTLEPCGVTVKTVWIFAPEKTSTGTYYALISAATSRNFHHPYSLTTLAPGVPLVTAPLAASTTRSAFAHQLWNAEARRPAELISALTC